MKNVIKIIGVIAILLSFQNVVVAEPEFEEENIGNPPYEERIQDPILSDIQAEKEVKEQEEKVKNAEGKSRNCYLKSLEVEGYEIEPKFDKDIIDYVIKGNVKENEITINAVADDENATIEGTGKIELNPEKDYYEIKVIAESEMIAKSYYIYLSEDKKEEVLNEAENIGAAADIKKEEKPKNYTNVIIISVIVAIAIIAILLIIVKKKKEKN